MMGSRHEIARRREEKPTKGLGLDSDARLAELLCRAELSEGDVERCHLLRERRSCLLIPVSHTAERCETHEVALQAESDGSSRSRREGPIGG
jgi:hypothetical protein